MVSQRYFIAAVLMAVLVLAGCGGNDTTPPPPRAVVNPAPSPTPAPALPTSFTVQDLGTLPNFTQSAALGINNSGQVVGLSENSNTPNQHAFLFSNGSLRDLGTLGGDGSAAQDINNPGQIVGQAQLPDNTPHAALFTNGTVQDLGTLGGRSSTAFAINDSGQIVGSADLLTTKHAFLFTLKATGNTMQDLGTLGGSVSEAHGVNNAGTIVGASDRTQGVTDNHAFQFSNGVMQDLGSLGGASSAMGINDAGHIVGFSVVNGVVSHAFFFMNGGMRDLGPLVSGGNSSALAINNSGVIVGSASDAAGNSVATVWSETDGVIHDLNTMIPANSGWVLQSANAVNDSGQIAGVGLHSGVGRAFLLTPVR